LRDDSSLPPTADYPRDIRLQYERENVGFYVSEHPLTAYQALAKKVRATDIANILTDDIGVSYNDKDVTLLAQITSFKVRTTKSGKQMASASIEDCTGSINATFFTNALVKFGHIAKPGVPLIFKGTVSCDDDRPAELVVFSVEIAKNNVVDREEVVTKNALLITVDNTTDYSFKRIKSLLSIFEGTTDVYILDKSSGKKLRASNSLRVTINQPMLDELADIVGESNIKLLH